MDNESKLNEIYLITPKLILKTNETNETHGPFRNIYSNYFCLCKGEHCFSVEISQNCKYRFYTFILDKYKYLYKKTEYLFIDFIFKTFSSDETSKIFRN